jgi:hypothetical protein
MSKITKSEIKTLAYKIPNFLKITSILSDEGIINPIPHSKNIELCASLYCYKTFASLEVTKNISAKELLNEKLGKFYSELTLNQVHIFTEIINNQKLNSICMDECVRYIYTKNSSSESAWDSRCRFFINAIANQIIYITSLTHWKNNSKYYLSLFSKYNKLEALLNELDRLGLTIPLLKEYINHLPSSTREMAEVQHGYVSMNFEGLEGRWVSKKL